MFLAALKVSIVWLDDWRLGLLFRNRFFRGWKSSFLSFVSFSLNSSFNKRVWKWFVWTVIDLWLCSQFYCHLGFRSKNKASVDLKFLLCCFYFLWASDFFELEPAEALTVTVRSAGASSSNGLIIINVFTLISCFAGQFAVSGGPSDKLNKMWFRLFPLHFDTFYFLFCHIFTVSL